MELKSRKTLTKKRDIIKAISNKIKVSDREARAIIVKIKERGYFVLSSNGGIKITKKRKEMLKTLEYFRAKRNGLNYNIQLLENIYNSK